MKQIITGLTLLATAAAAQAAAPIEGRWTNPKGNVVIAVAPCGAAYCGHVIAATAKAQASARKGGTNKLIGAELMSGFKPDGHGGYRGRVFEPKRNLHGTATIRPIGSDAIEVRGCAFAGLLCRSQRWSRFNG